LLVDRPRDERLVWVVDQAEEIFTLCRDEHERAQFLTSLLYAASAPGGRTSVILTLRADFYARLAAYPRVAQAVGAHQCLVGPLDADELRRVIEEPARQVGLTFEPGLVDTILDDVGREPGALPLLEHALLELWSRRREQRLTLAAYRESGGVEGSLAQRADAIYERFTPEQQAIARRTLLRLIEPGEGTEDTRRRATLDEVGGDGEVEEVIGALVEARLLTASTEPQTATRWIEVSHEALIRGWPRLRAWIDEDRTGLCVHRRITESALEWARCARDEDLLYRGTRLLEAEEWTARDRTILNDLEREFLDTSATARDRARRRRRRQLSTVAGTILLGALAAVVAALVALDQRNAARSAERRALSRELAAASGTALASDPTLGRLLAIEANERSNTAEARSALGRALIEDHERTILHADDQIRSAVYSPDSRHVATVDENSNVIIWNADSGLPSFRFRRSSAKTFSGLSIRVIRRWSSHATEGGSSFGAPWKPRSCGTSRRSAA